MFNRDRGNWNRANRGPTVLIKLCDKIVIKKRLFEAYKPVFIEILGIKMFGKHSFDLEKQFTFYASYHNNPINVLIHILCIWPILATGLVILQVRYYRVTSVSFSSCQRNLIQTFQIEGMIALIKKIDLIFSWDLLNGQKQRSKSAKIWFSKSIFNFKNPSNLSKKHFW